MREITEEQFRLLEQHHGKGMVIPMTVGDTDFAFRRIGEVEVDLMLEGIASKTYGIAEQLAVRCVLSVDAPDQNKAQDRSAKGDEDRKKRKVTAHQAIVEERARLEGMWAEAQGMCDVIGTKFVKACGWQWAVESEALGGGLYMLKCTQTQVDGVTPDIEDVAEEASRIELRARRFTRTEYQEFRRRLITGERGDADRYAYRVLIEGANKEEVARLYPFLLIEIGKALSTLGMEGKTVSIKKFGKPGSPSTDPNSTKQPEEISP